MITLYNLFIHIYTLAIRLAAPFNHKARQWVEGRRHWSSDLEEALRPLRDRPLLWMHCASLGEFEQGRPVLEAIKQQWPDTAVLLTFFSPSGYEIRKDTPLADYVAYLPADTPENARRWVQIIQPALVLFVKYEFWYHHLQAIQQRKIPLILISAIIHKGQLFFRPGGKPFRRLLQGFTHVFVQNEASANKLRQLGITNFTVAGDTRIDRVAQIAEQARSFPLVVSFVKGSKCLIAGSTWPPDEDRLQELLNGNFPDNWKCILAPHQISESHLQQIETRFRLPLLRYSRLQEVDPGEYRLLLIDNIGMLSSLYQYGHLAYIGGGFGEGIHNTLEPVAFGLPVLFGPNYQKFEEARQLASRGGAFPVKTAEDIHRTLARLQNPDNYLKASEEARQYVERNRGATRKVVDFLRQSSFFEREEF